MTWGHPVGGESGLGPRKIEWKNGGENDEGGEMGGNSGRRVRVRPGTIGISTAAALESHLESLDRKYSETNELISELSRKVDRLNGLKVSSDGRLLPQTGAMSLGKLSS